MGLVRIFYSSYFLVFQPYRIHESISELPQSLFAPPLGPMALLSGFPNGHSIMLLEVGITISLFFLLLGVFTRSVSTGLTILLITSAGIRFSTGKIDHDILLLILPLFFRNAWGHRLALLKTAYKKEYFLPYLVSFYFLSSALIKLQSGYLDHDTQSVYQWLMFYENNYGFSGVLKTYIIGLSNFYLEILDWVTVLAEICLAILFFLKKTRTIGVLFALCFHLIIFLVFRIDFSKLYFIYFLLLDYPFKNPRFVKNDNTKVLLVVASSSLFLMYFVKIISKVLPTIFFFSLILLFLLVGTIWKKSVWSTTNIGDSYRQGAWISLVLAAPLLITILWTEPYPAIIGPGFRGNVNGCEQQMFTKNGNLVSPQSLFGIENPFAQNLGFHFFPNPEFQGHETREWRSSHLNERDFLVNWQKQNC
jgi:hypothetical protein